jgi:hypothetical protein
MLGDILHDDHIRSESALGYDGPPQEVGATVRPWRQIPDEADYDHHDYLPSSNPATNEDPEGNPK